jgi:plasmid maintenance system killer protein
MDVFFGSARLEKLLLSRKQSTREYGAENAKLIKGRLDNLHIARNLEQVRNLPGGLHELHGDRAGTLAIRLKGGLRLIITPADESPPRKPRPEGTRGLDWNAIVAVVVIAVEDYHD